MKVSMARRTFVGASISAAVLMTSLRPALAGVSERRLAMRHLHTGERIDTVYWRSGTYDRDGLAELDHHLRDWRRDEVLQIDRNLVDLVFAVAKKAGVAPEFEIISGYRSPATNEWLRKRGGGVAKRSLHLVGKAIDLRLKGVRLADLRKLSLSFGAGGVGYYPASNFVHLDTGRPRQWQG